MSEHLIPAPSEQRTLPAVVYGLYLLAFATAGVSGLIGLIIAYAQRGGASPRAATHYTFQIRTFWLTIAWWLIGGAMVGLGLPLSLILIGLPLLKLGLLILTLVGAWWVLRCVLGAVYLARDEAYPRPRSWLV